MARYTDAVCRLCRRQGMKLFLKGDKCFTPKCAVERRSYGPGDHGQRRRKVSDYGVQLKEKQKIRDIYGVLERQFRKIFEEAERRPGITGENLLQLLEMRLDNVVYRLGWATSQGSGAPVGAPRPLQPARAKDGYSVCSRQGGRRGRRPRGKQAERVLPGGDPQHGEEDRTQVAWPGSRRVQADVFWPRLLARRSTRSLANSW